MRGDRDLISGFLKGSAEDFEELVRRYEREVYFTAFHIMGDGEEAKDIVQEAFIRVLEGVGGLRDPSRFRPWLLKITANLARDRLRSRREWVLESREDLSSSGDEAFERLSHSQDHQRLYRLLSVLPPRQRMAVVLRIFNELSFKDVAEIMECQVATARSLFWAAIREMKRRWKQNEV